MVTAIQSISTQSHTEKPTEIFHLESNPIKLGAKRVLYFYAIVFFPLFVATGTIYTYLKLPQYTFAATIIGIAAILTVIFCKVSKNCSIKSTYQITIRDGKLELIKDNKPVEQIPLNDLKIENTFWGSTDALHPAMILKRNRNTSISIGTQLLTSYYSQGTHLLDFTDYLITDKNSWERLSNRLSTFQNAANPSCG